MLTFLLALCLAFLRSTTARDYARRIVELVSSVNTEAKSARYGEKKAEEEKVAEEKAKDVEKRASQAKEAQKKAEDDLAAARLEHSRYLQVALPAALDEARRQLVEDYQQSDEFNARLLAGYKEGMWDMKDGFTLTNPTVTGVNCSFVPEASGETAAEGERAPEAEDGEVTRGSHVAEEVVIIDEPKQPAIPD